MWIMPGLHQVLFCRIAAHPPMYRMFIVGQNFYKSRTPAPVSYNSKLLFQWLQLETLRYIAHNKESVPASIFLYCLSSILVLFHSYRSIAVRPF